jgi:peptidyl-prolyl cis-trans isomerase C
MEMKRFSGAVTAMLLSALPACSTVTEKAATTDGRPVLNQTVEKVNGTPISRAELDRTVKTLLAQNRVPANLPPELMHEAEASALEQLTSTELLYQQAAKLKLPDLDQLVAQQMAQEKERFPSQEEFEASVKSVGMTMDEVRDFTRKQIVINKFVEERFASKEMVSESEARKFYDDNVDKYFKKGERVRASHILIGTDKAASPDEKLKAKEKIEAILKRVQGGEDFAELARKESTCPSAKRGGDLGLFGKGRMVPSFEKAAFAMKPGEVSGVVETLYGYHIIKVTEKLPPTTEKFEDVKGKITEYLKAEKIKKAVAAYLEELRGKAKIEKS